MSNLPEIKELQVKLGRLRKRQLLSKSSYISFINLSARVHELASNFDGSQLGDQYLAIVRRKRYQPLLIFAGAKQDILFGKVDRNSKFFELSKSQPILINNNLEGLIDDQVSWLMRVEHSIFKTQSESVGDFELIEYLSDKSSSEFARRTVGNGIALILAEALVKLHRRENLTFPKKDDIACLRANLIAKSSNRSLKTFLKKRYSKFDLSDHGRNGSAHIYERPPTKQEILLMLELAKDLKRTYNI